MTGGVSSMRKYEPIDLVGVAHMDRVTTGVYAHAFFDGPIDVDRLADAVDKVATIVPETLSAIDSKRIRFVPLPVTGKDVITEIEGPVGAGGPWDMRKESQVKILVGHDRSHDSMIVSISHILSDGMGLEQYVSLLAGAYNGHLPHVRNNRNLDALLSTITVGPPTQAEKHWKTLPTQYLTAPCSNTEYFFRCATIPEQTMNSLHTKAKEFGAHLNDVFIAGCSRVVTRILNEPVIRFVCPVDFRRLGDVGPLSVANMSGLYLMILTVNPGDSFSTTVAQVSRVIAEERSRNRSFSSLIWFQKFCTASPIWLSKRIASMRYIVPPITYSNFGALQPLSFGEATATAYYVTGAYRPYPELSLSVSSYAGATSFVSTIVGDKARADAGEDIARQAAQECESWLAE